METRSSASDVSAGEGVRRENKSTTAASRYAPVEDGVAEIF
jgi:hypothetical protein